MAPKMLIRFVAVCLLCIGAITGLVYLFKAIF